MRSESDRADEALEISARDFRGQAKVIELHFFGGLNMARYPRCSALDELTFPNVPLSAI